MRNKLILFFILFINICFGQCNVDRGFCYDSWNFFCYNYSGVYCGDNRFFLSTDSFNENSIKECLNIKSDEKCCKKLLYFETDVLKNLQNQTKAELSCNQIIALATLRACIGAEVLYRSDVWKYLVKTAPLTDKSLIKLKGYWKELVIGKKNYSTMRDTEFNKFLEDE